MRIQGLVLVAMVLLPACGKRSRWDFSVSETCGAFEQAVVVSEHQGFAVADLVERFSVAEAEGRTPEGQVAAVAVRFAATGEATQVSLTSGPDVPQWCDQHYPMLVVPGAWTLDVDGVVSGTWPDSLVVGPEAAFAGGSTGAYPDERGNLTTLVAPPASEFEGGHVVPWVTFNLTWDVAETITDGRAEWIAFSEDESSSASAGFLAAWGTEVDRMAAE